LGDYDKACLWAESATGSFLSGRCTAGNHRLWASALEAAGDIPAAAQAVKRGITYEAPWDDANKALNIAMYDKLMGDIANQAKLEEFEGIFGNAIGIAESKSTVVGAPTCWKMIKDEGAVDKFLTNGSSDDKPLFSGRLGEDETALKVETLQSAVLSVATGDTEITDEDSSQEMPTSGAHDDDDDVDDVAYSPNVHFIVDGKEEECLAVYDNVQLTKYMEKA